MCKIFYGALKVYEDALEGKANLEQALMRNLYGNVPSLHVKEIADYVKVCNQFLKNQKVENFAKIEWPSIKKKVSC